MKFEQPKSVIEVNSSSASELAALLGRKRVAQLVQVPKRLLFVGREALHERGIIQLCAAIIGWQIAEHAQPAQKQLAALDGHGLPARKERIANILALLRREAFEITLAIENGVLLLRGQAVPLLEIFANLGLALGRQDS